MLTLKRTSRQAYNYRRSVCGCCHSLTRSSFRAHHSLRGKQKQSDDSLARQGRASERASGRTRRSQEDEVRVGEQGCKHLLPLPTANLRAYCRYSHCLPLLLPLLPPLSFSLSAVLWPLLLWLQLTPQAAAAKEFGVIGLLTFPFPKISHRGFWSLLWRRCPAASSTGGASVLRRVLCACLCFFVLYACLY